MEEKLENFPQKTPSMRCVPLHYYQTNLGLFFCSSPLEETKIVQNLYRKQIETVLKPDVSNFHISDPKSENIKEKKKRGNGRATVGLK